MHLQLLAECGGRPTLNPIVFEETGRMYHFTYPDPECDDDDSECGLARLLIYHCPLCGGAAPKSKALS